MASQDILDVFGAAVGALAHQVGGPRYEDQGNSNELNFRLQAVVAYIQNLTHTVPGRENDADDSQKSGFEYPELHRHLG